MVLGKESEAVSGQQRRLDMPRQTFSAFCPKECHILCYYLNQWLHCTT